MNTMMIINKQDEVSTEGGGNVLIYLIQMEVEIVGDYGDLCEISIRNDILICLTCHAMSGICVRFWRKISSTEMVFSWMAYSPMFWDKGSWLWLDPTSHQLADGDTGECPKKNPRLIS